MIRIVQIVQKPIEIIGLFCLLVLCTIVGIVRLIIFPIKLLGKIRQKKPTIMDPEKDVWNNEGLDIAYKAFGSRAEKYSVIAARTNDRRGAIRAIMFELLAYYTLITLS